MQAAFASLTAIAVSLHAILGCCIHHAHRTPAEMASVGNENAGRTACKHACHAHHGQEPSEQPGERKPSESCQEGECVSLRAEKSASVNPLEGFQALAAAAILPHSGLGLAGECRAESVGWILPDPPLRSHLMNRVLRI